MSDVRKKDARWTLSPNFSGNYSYEAAQLAVLMDLRDELKRLNTLLHCHNFVEVPSILRGIKRNTTKKRKPKVAEKPRLRAVSLMGRSSND